MEAKRDAKGKFLKGASGNPGGRTSNKALAEELKKFTPKCVEVLMSIIENTHARNADRIKAIEIILDRAYGKPRQEVQVDGFDGTLKIIDMDPEGAEYNA